MLQKAIARMIIAVSFLSIADLSLPKIWLKTPWNRQFVILQIQASFPFYKRHGPGHIWVHRASDSCWWGGKSHLQLSVCSQDWHQWWESILLSRKRNTVTIETTRLAPRNVLETVCLLARRAVHHLFLLQYLHLYIHTAFFSFISRVTLH